MFEVDNISERRYVCHIRLLACILAPKLHHRHRCYDRTDNLAFDLHLI